MLAQTGRTFAAHNQNRSQSFVRAGFHRQPIFYPLDFTIARGQTHYPRFQIGVRPLVILQNFLNCNFQLGTAVTAVEHLQFVHDQQRALVEHGNIFAVPFGLGLREHGKKFFVDDDSHRKIPLDDFAVVFLIIAARRVNLVHALMLKVFAELVKAFANHGAQRNEHDTFLVAVLQAVQNRHFAHESFSRTGRALDYDVPIKIFGIHAFL